MAKNLYLNIDDDVTKVVRKISREKDRELTLVLPKQSLLFFDVVNLKLLKRQAEDLGKDLSILTMDPKGQQKATEAGFVLKSFEDLKKKGPSVEGIRTAPVLAAKKPQTIHTGKATVVHSATIAQPQPIREMQPAREVQAPVQDPVRTPAPMAVPKTRTRQGFGMRNFFVLSSIIAIVLIALLLIVVLPQANVTVYAHSQQISKDLQITLDGSASQPDTDRLVMPAKAVNNTEKLTQQFDSTGQQNLGAKAQGKIQIYNFTGKTLRLKSTTTVIIAGDKKYQFTEDVNNIKPTGYFANTKDINPATLIPEVQIVAEQSGEDYNLPAGTRFEIQNAALGLVQTLYAQSTVAITGGTTRYTAIVSQQDLDNATNAMKTAAVDSLRNSLANQGLTLADSGTNVQLSNLTFDKKAGDNSVTFNASADAQVSGVTYNYNDLKNMVESRVELTIGQDKHLLTDRSEKLSTVLKSFDPSTNKGTLNAHLDSFAVANLDKNAIAAEIRGQTAEQVKEYLLSNSGIDGVDVAFSPFWVKSVPKYSGKINISIQNKQ